ncbi:MAG TPA: hypothetical protein VMF03_10200 [Steroidobacteraceae bacterium]|nr:hypothetical protein [Steroidobacteraceae bacterium]
MSVRRLAPVLIGVIGLGCGLASGADTSDDRIVFSADGSTLSGTHGGGGASLGWLHNFDADTLVGIAAEYQELSAAHWSFASANGSQSFGPENQRYSVYAEAHEGAGDDGPHPFHYRIETLGLDAFYFRQFTAQLEDKQINVESTHGNLPKVGLSYLWSPRLQTSVTYSYSLSGNLGTRLPGIRIDAYGHDVTYTAGAAYGPAAAAVLGIDLTIPVRRLKEAYLGVARPFRSLHSDLTLTADYQDLSGTKRVIVTLACVFHVGTSPAR